MGVIHTNSTMPGAVTPVCNVCGVFLCWDIAEHEYVHDQAFWDEWICQECHGGVPLSLKAWRRQQGKAQDSSHQTRRHARPN